MEDRARFENALLDGHLLPVAEFIHRVRNDYARTISLASAIAANSASDETRAALHDVIRDLRSAAEIHNVLCPPMNKGEADLTVVLTRLCCVMTASAEIQHRGVKVVLRTDHPILIDAGRCWHASLAVAEFINNSCRHAFRSRSGTIFVTVFESGDQVFCQVSDDGTPRENGRTGLGTCIVDALAIELDGQVERSFTHSGASVILSFRKRPPIAVFEPDKNVVSQMESPRPRSLFTAVDKCDS